MEIKKKIVREISVSTKFTAEQNKKLVALAKENGIARSNLVYQLVAEAYKVATKTKKEF